MNAKVPPKSIHPLAHSSLLLEQTGLLVNKNIVTIKYWPTKIHFLSPHFMVIDDEALLIEWATDERMTNKRTTTVVVFAVVVTGNW